MPELPGIPWGQPPWHWTQDDSLKTGPRPSGTLCGWRNAAFPTCQRVSSALLTSGGNGWPGWEGGRGGGGGGGGGGPWPNVATAVASSPGAPGRPIAFPIRRIEASSGPSRVTTGRSRRRGGPSKPRGCTILRPGTSRLSITSRAWFRERRIVATVPLERWGTRRESRAGTLHGAIPAVGGRGVRTCDHSSFLQVGGPNSRRGVEGEGHSSSGRESASASSPRAWRAS